MVYHREDIAVALGNDLHQFAQRHLREDGDEVGLQHIVHLQEREHIAVFVVREEFAFLRETHGIEAVRLEYLDSEVRDDGHHHEWHEEVVAACEFGNEEDTREGRVHNACHQSRHAHECEVRLGYKNTDGVEHARGNKAREGTHKERGREDTAHATTAVGSHRSHYLKEDDEREVAYDNPCGSTEELERTVINRRERVSVNQLCDNAIAFAIERGKEEDEDTKGNAANEYLEPEVTDFMLHPLLHAVHAPREVQRYQSADHAQQ